MGARGKAGSGVAPAIFVSLTTEELSNFCHMSVLQMVTVFSAALHGSCLVWTVHGKRHAVPAQQHTYTYHIPSGWSVAKHWQFAVYFKQRTSPSLPFSFDSLPVSLNCLMLTLNFLVFKNLGSNKTACLFLSFFSCTFVSVIPAYNHPLIHTSYKQTSPLLLRCCP